MASTTMIHFGRDPGKLVRFLGGEYTGYFQDVQKTLQVPVRDHCDNILSGYLSVVTRVFSHQDGIYGFKFPKRFFGDLFQRSHSVLFFLNLII